MKALYKAGILLLITAIWVGCEGDFRKEARGGFGEVVVMMDSTQHNSQTAQAIRETYGQGLETLPSLPLEPRFDLRFRDVQTNEDLERLKRSKNLIIAAPIDDSTNTARFIRALLSDKIEKQVRNGDAFAFPLQDKWYRNQWAMILTAPSDSALAREVRSSEEVLVNSLLDKEFARWRAEIYDRGEKVKLEDSLWTEHGWKIRIQHDWIKHLDTTHTGPKGTYHFLTMRRVLPQNDRWFWAWWKNDVDSIAYVNKDWINAKRDSLMKKWIRGSRDSSYVTTSYRRPVKTDTLRVDGHRAFETLGTWYMTNDAMGGPFANLTVYDDETDRLFMLEFGQFAPKYQKRRFVRQFRAMLRTFRSDSTWQTSAKGEAAAQQ